MAQEFPTATFFESLCFNRWQIVPKLREGLFLRRPRRAARNTRRNFDGRVVGFCHRLQEKYQSDGLFIRVFTQKALLLFDRACIQHVLDHSPDPYGPPGIKKKGMGKFQPHAVTISEGDAWRERRRFNEAVLDSGALHRHADTFFGIVRAEVEATRQATGQVLTWDALVTLFERLTLQVVFGTEAREETALTGELEALMKASNLPIGSGDAAQLASLYSRFHRHLEAPQEGCLAAVAAATPSSEETKVASQIPHWIFAMKGTLAGNTARALAVIVSHPEIEAKVREEMAAADLTSAKDIAGLRYLAGCIHEAMRLWPTTPMLSRVALRDDQVAGTPVPKGMQVLILNTFNHRNRERLEHSDKVHPERWRDAQPDYLLNHLSNGPQVCAGFDLALFLAQAVLTTLLAEGRYTLERPKLDPRAPMPAMLDYFKLRWRRV